MIVKQPTCSNSNGSITGITIKATGSKLTYSWLDANDKEVGTKLDLVNVGPGSYRLQVTDRTDCPDPVISAPIVLKADNVVIISDSPLIVESSCSSNGSISGLKVTGATFYQWHCLETGTIYQSSTTPDLFNIPPGNYTLLASNSSCSLQSRAFVVPSNVNFPQVTKVEILPPACHNTKVDAIKLTLTRSVSTAVIRYTLFNVDDIALVKGTMAAGVATLALVFTDKPAGVYKLSVSNFDNSCPVQLGVYEIPDPKLIIYPDSSQIFNDKCNQHKGAIFPYIPGQSTGKGNGYFWKDLSTGKLISQSRTVNSLAAGTYRLDYYDLAGCTASAEFVVGNDSPPIDPPAIDGQTICLPGTANLFVKNSDAASGYKLYASLNDTIPLAISQTGFFNPKVDETTTFYVSRTFIDCESVRVTVTVNVIASIKIPNAISPNNDGINDVWNISGIEKFPGSEIQVFNRDGQRVFYSLNNSSRFNGTINGAPLPVGVYYYVIDVKQPVCFGKISGSLTIIR